MRPGYIVAFLFSASAIRAAPSPTQERDREYFHLRFWSRLYRLFWYTVIGNIGEAIDNVLSISSTCRDNTYDVGTDGYVAQSGLS